jgi:hypothetical protein
MLAKLHASPAVTAMPAMLVHSGNPRLAGGLANAARIASIMAAAEG